MPETAPRVKRALTDSFGAEVQTYDISTDHVTGVRDRLTREIAETRGGIEASPYNDPHVIAGGHTFHASRILLLTVKLSTIEILFALYVLPV